MAHSTIDTTSAEPVRLYLEGVAKSLVDRLFGPKGPAWGTRFTEIENTVLAIRELLGESILDNALQRQADEAAQRPEEFVRCPKCDGELDDRPPESRTVMTRAGQTTWDEPANHCPRCRRAFFPSGQKPRDRSDRTESGLAAEDRLGRRDSTLV